EAQRVRAAPPEARDDALARVRIAADHAVLGRVDEHEADERLGLEGRADLRDRREDEPAPPADRPQDAAAPPRARDRGALARELAGREDELAPHAGVGRGGAAEDQGEVPLDGALAEVNAVARRRAVGEEPAGARGPLGELGGGGRDDREPRGAAVAFFARVE